MFNRKTTTLICCLGLLALLVAATPANALRVGWNLDIHQDKFMFDQYGQPDYANDFHIWGVLESGDPEPPPNPNPPKFVSQVNFEVAGPGGPAVPGGIVMGWDGCTIGGSPTRPLPNASLWPPGGPDPEPPFYYFEGSWSTQQQIPYCTWMHFGLEFDETCHNVGYWLQGVWTKDGVDPETQPIYGFKVVDDFVDPGNQHIRIQNASGIETQLIEMSLLVLDPIEGAEFPLEDLNMDFFNSHPEYVWTDVPAAMLPTYLAGDGGGIDSFFDVYLAPLGLEMQPGDVLLARQFSEYSYGVEVEGGGEGDYEIVYQDFWNLEMHGSHPEPTTLVMLLTGGVAMLLWRRRRSE